MKTENCLDLYLTVTWCQLLVHTVLNTETRGSTNDFLVFFANHFEDRNECFLFQVKCLLALIVFELLFLQPVLGGHPVLLDTGWNVLWCGDPLGDIVTKRRENPLNEFCLVKSSNCSLLLPYLT